MQYLKSVALAFALSLTLISCSSESSDSSGASDPSNTVDPTVTPGAEGEGEGTQTTSSNSSVTDYKVIAAVKTRVADVEGATFSSIGNYAMNASGQIVFTARYIDASGKNRSGIWYGDSSDTQILIKTGDLIPGSVGHESFDYLGSSFHMASDGSTAVVGRLVGDGSVTALLLIENEEIKGVLKTTDLQLGVVGDMPINQFGNVSHSPSGTLFSGGYSTNSTLWLYKDGSTIAVASEDDIVGVDSAGCGYYLSDSYRYFVNDHGAVYFQARLSGACRESTSLIKAVVKYQDGRYETVLAGEALVPGSGSSYFKNPYVIGVETDGSVVVHADMYTQTSANFIDTHWSYWRIGNAGEMSLILQEGEIVPSPITKFPDHLPDGEMDSFVMNHQGRYAFLAKLSSGGSGCSHYGCDDYHTLLTGNAHSGQPHEDVSEPGNAVLAVIADENTSPGMQFPANAYYRSLGSPAIDQEGNVAYFAAVNSAGELGYYGLWEFDLNHNRTILAIDGDDVTVGGHDGKLENVGFSLSGLATLDSIYKNNTSLLFRARIDIDTVGWSWGEVDSLVVATKK